jgi:hypothetical protein
MSMTIAAALLFMAFAVVLSVIEIRARWRPLTDLVDEEREGERLEAYIDHWLLDETKEDMEKTAKS